MENNIVYHYLALYELNIEYYGLFEIMIALVTKQPTNSTSSRGTKTKKRFRNQIYNVF